MCVCAFAALHRAASDDLWLEIDLRGAKAKCLSKADALFIVCHAGLARLSRRAEGAGCVFVFTISSTLMFVSSCTRERGSGERKKGVETVR